MKINVSTPERREFSLTFDCGVSHGLLSVPRPPRPSPGDGEARAGPRGQGARLPQQRRGADHQERE